MAGLLLGAILDRAYEAILNKSWGTVFGFGSTGAVACAAIGFVIATTPSGPDPKELAGQARSAIFAEWHKDPELQGTTIQDITLAYKGGRMYAGFIDATIGGELVRFSLEVSVEDEFLKLAWQSIDE